MAIYDQPSRSRAFFGRRKGHPLKPQQAALFDALLPRLALDLAAPAPADLATLFPDAADAVRLEIGFGGGEHLVAEAERAPRTGFIGVEPFLNHGEVLAAIAARTIRRNIRLHFGDAIFAAMAADGTISRLTSLSRSVDGVIGSAAPSRTRLSPDCARVAAAASSAA